jgi:hypothetical protein
MGFDLVLVDGRTAAFSWNFFRSGMLASRFCFELEGEPRVRVVVQVADPVTSGGDLGGLRLLLDGELVYAEGTLRELEPDLPLPSTAPGRTGVGSLPIPGDEGPR